MVKMIQIVTEQQISNVGVRRFCRVCRKAIGESRLKWHLSHKGLNA